MSTHERVLWAVDAFEHKSDHNKALKTIESICKAFELEVEPVYILSSGQMQIQQDLYPEWADEYRSHAEKQLNLIAKESPFSKVSNASILTAEGSSLRDAAEELIQYAKKKKIKFIISNTHAKEGLPRFLLGSFTETLLLQSKIPVLVTNPSIETVSKIKHILLPTDFSNSSRATLKDATELAMTLNAKLTLYHKELMPLYLSFPEASFYTVYLEDMKRDLEKKAKSWLSALEKKDISCTLEIDRSKELGPLGKHILKYAEAHAVDMICFQTNSTATSANLLGSTARYLARHAHCPIWIQHG